MLVGRFLIISWQNIFLYISLTPLRILAVFLEEMSFRSADRSSSYWLTMHIPGFDR